mmetsp:Transcript_25439/g.61281  ORF Transcript_25439/g.61281 Transcript_25439/m.61281 type:complete len:369 (+) Transcript_25439:109-1215(+)
MSFTEEAVVVVGGINQDIIGRSDQKLSHETSNIGSIVKTWGGVAHNIALCLARLGALPYLIAVIGDDGMKDSLEDYLHKEGIRTSGIIEAKGYPSCSYLALLDHDGDLVASVADMKAMKELSGENLGIMARTSWFNRAKLVAVDANVPEDTLQFLCERIEAKGNQAVFYEPTSLEKSVRGINMWKKGLIHMMSPNAMELNAMAKMLKTQSSRVRSNQKFSFVSKQELGTKIVSRQLLDDLLTMFQEIPNMKRNNCYHIIVTRGKYGVLLASLENCRQQKKTISLYKVSSVPVPSIVTTSGAGDTLAGATIWWLVNRGSKHVPSLQRCPSELLAKALHIAVKAASMTLQSESSVSEKLNSKRLILHASL